MTMSGLAKRKSPANDSGDDLPYSVDSRTKRVKLETSPPSIDSRATQDSPREFVLAHEPSEADPMVGPPVITCGHPIHSAYAAVYKWSACPRCLFEVCYERLQISQNIILERGGARHWAAQIKTLRSASEWHVYKAIVTGIKGGDPRNNVSHRHYKILFVNLIIILQDLSAVEEEWGREQPLETRAMSIEHSRRQHEYGATATLERYEDVIREPRVEKNAAMVSRKRGRENEIAADQAYLHSSDIDNEAHGMTYSQKSFVSVSVLPCTEGEDTPPVRKRRRVNSTVGFDQFVYVRSEVDVDVLRKSATSLSQDEEAFIKDGPLKPEQLPSILRTAPLEDSGPAPKRPHHVVPLEEHCVRKGFCKRGHRAYKPGKWASPQGYEKVDTSGKTMDDFRYFLYVGGLQLEAQEWDAADMNQRLEELTAQQETVLVPALEGQLVRVDGRWQLRARETANQAVS